MRSALVALCFLPLFSLSCKKNAREVVVPSACFSVNKTSVQIGDTITFTDCSVAQDVKLTIRTSNQLSGPAYLFDSDRKFSITMDTEGVYEAKLMASNQNEAPIDVAIDTITVSP